MLRDLHGVKGVYRHRSSFGAFIIISAVVIGATTFDVSPAVPLCLNPLRGLGVLQWKCRRLLAEAYVLTWRIPTVRVAYEVNSKPKLETRCL